MKKIILALLLAVFAYPVSAFEIPSLKGRVNDYANLLGSAETSSLVERIKAFEAKTKTGAQIAVLTLPSLDGESIDQVRSDVFRAWHLGQAGKDNGLLVVIAPVDRKVAIEVGYGLESVLPDSAVKRIVEDQMKPNLKKGAENWFKALDAGVVSLSSAVLASEVDVGAHKDGGSTSTMFLIVVGLMGLGAVGVALLLIAGNRERKRCDRIEAERMAMAAQASAAAKASAARASGTYSRASSRGYSNPYATAAGVGAGASLGASTPAKPSIRRSSDDSSYSSGWSSSSSSSSSWGSSSSSDSGYSGGGGDSGGGGSSSDF